MTRGAMFFLGWGIISGFNATISVVADRPERIVVFNLIAMVVNLVIFAPLCIRDEKDEKDGDDAQ